MVSHAKINDDYLHVKECLAPGDEVELMSYRVDSTPKIPPSNPYGTNMYKAHYRPPPLPGSPRELSPTDHGEDVLIPIVVPISLSIAVKIFFNPHLRYQAQTARK